MIKPEVYGDKWVRMSLSGGLRRYAVKPHPEAPLFECDEIGDRYAFVVGERIKDFFDGIQEKGGEEKAKVLLEFMRQFALVNLWFCLKFILGPFGPWDRLTDHLHLDLANYCQSDYCLKGGAKSAVAIGRSHYKSTVRTSGLTVWLVLRDPNVKILILSSVFDHAARFCRTARSAFENNELIRTLWPKHFKTGKTVWNDTEWVSPARTKSGAESTVTSKGVGSTSASQHFTHILVDDPISIEDLDKEMEGNASMDGKKIWLNSALIPLLESPKRSVLMYTFTFYAMDDYYMENIVPHVKYFFGYREEMDFIEEKPSGSWSIYWRPSMQADECIFPEEMSVEFLMEIMATDPWMYQTQYQNRPMLMEGSHFKDYPIHDAVCAHFEKGNEESRVVLFQEDGEKKVVLLKNCDMLLVVDWAASKKNKDEKKSKTALHVWVETPDAESICIDGYSKKQDVPTTFKQIFQLMRKWKDYVRAAVVETNAMQLGVAQLLRDKCVEEKFFFPIIEDFVKGDKEARIRVNFGSKLIGRKIYCTTELKDKLVEEKNMFGAVKGMFDNLDAAEKAQRLLIKPMTVRDNRSVEEGTYAEADMRDYSEVDSEMDDNAFWEEMERLFKNPTRL